MSNFVTKIIYENKVSKHIFIQGQASFIFGFYRHNGEIRSSIPLIRQKTFGFSAQGIQLEKFISVLFHQTLTNMSLIPALFHVFLAKQLLLLVSTGEFFSVVTSVIIFQAFGNTYYF